MACNEIFSLIYYKQLDLLVIEIGWMVIEIWEGGNLTTLADSLGIELLKKTCYKHSESCMR